MSRRRRAPGPREAAVVALPAGAPRAELVADAAKRRVPWARPAEGVSDENFAEGFARAVVKVVNEFRRSRGLPPLT